MTGNEWTPSHGLHGILAGPKPQGDQSQPVNNQTTSLFASQLVKDREYSIVIKPIPEQTKGKLFSASTENINISSTC